MTWLIDFFAAMDPTIRVALAVAAALCITGSVIIFLLVEGIASRWLRRREAHRRRAAREALAQTRQYGPADLPKLWQLADAETQLIRHHDHADAATVQFRTHSHDGRIR